MVRFYNPWYCQKTFVFLRFSGDKFCNLSNKTEKASNEGELTSQLTDPASPKKKFWGKNSKLSELDLNMHP